MILYNNNLIVFKIGIGMLSYDQILSLIGVRLFHLKIFL